MSAEKKGDELIIKRILSHSARYSIIYDVGFVLLRDLHPEQMFTQEEIIREDTWAGFINKMADVTLL